MSNNKVDISKVNKIIGEVINAVDGSRDQIVDIIEHAREEHQNLELKLENLKNKIQKVIHEVDTLEIQDKTMRNKLANVSKNFKVYSEAQIKDVYDKASEIKVKYITMRNEEKSLREARDEIEISIKKSLRAIESGERVLNQISIAVGYLKGEILSVIEGLDSDSEMFIGIKILEAQENERKRVSRDIHDGPAQHIANIVMKADICEKLMHKDVAKGLHELSELKGAVRVALKEVRNIIFDLRPMTLDDLGLNQTIEMLLGKIKESASFEIKKSIKPMQTEVEQIIQVAVYRIIQEVFNNIQKHAKADTVYISVEYGLKYLQIKISDDGRGFPVEETLEKVKEEGRSYGLLGILDRVKQLQGEIDIESGEGAGTTYNVRLPVSREVIKDEREGH